MGEKSMSGDKMPRLVVAESRRGMAERCPVQLTRYVRTDNPRREFHSHMRTLAKRGIGHALIRSHNGTTALFRTPVEGLR